MLPNPFGNPAISMLNETLSQSLDNTSKMFHSPMSYDKSLNHKECKASLEDIEGIAEVLASEHKTTRSEVKIPKEDWENLKLTVEALISDHKMLNAENKEYRKALVMHRS